jgi:TolB protein
VFSAAATGGPARQELPAGNGGRVSWAAWSPDGRSIAYTVGDSLFLRAGGAPRRLATFLEPSMCAWSPDGATIACASGNARFFASGEGFGNLSPSWIVLCRVSNGTLTTITDRASLNHSPIWSPDGRWLYYVSDRLGSRDVYALRISAGNGAEGDPRRLTTGLGVQSISLSADSRLAYSVLTATANIWSLPIPTHGPVSVSTAVPVTTGSQVIETVSLPSDGQWLLFDSNLGGNSDVYRMRWPKGEPERLTTDPADEFGPELSPDGREVAFHSWRGGNRDIYVLPLDGGPVQQVTSSPGQEWIPTWSPDGRSLTFAEATPQGALWIVRREPNGAWGTPRRRIPRGAAWPTFSPDGTRLVYSTDPLMSGGSLLVVPVGSGAPVMLVDASQPGVPRAQKAEWSPDGRTIYFKSHDERDNAAIWSVPATGGRLTLLVRFDDPERPSYRGVMSVGNGRFYFPVENRQSDVWVVETGVR